MSRFIPQKIYIDIKARSFPLTRRILKNSPDVPYEVVRNRRDIDSALGFSKDPIGQGKKFLFLGLQTGAFVKPCPCTPGYIDCHYFIINAVLNCPLDCTYCILQLYLAHPLTTVFVNQGDLWRELDGFLRRRKGRFVRIGTGELADSLALDHLLQTGKEFVSYFRGKANAFFELKTKTVNIDGLLDCAPADNLVISWSLNSEKIGRQEEKGAPSVHDRIEAARLVSRKGFPVGFHFDPLIFYPGWEEDYGQVIDELLAAVPSSRIRWISLGSLRFPPALKPVIEKRFPRSKIIYGEMVPGRDGKLRYFKPLRLELYRKIVGFLRHGSGTRIPLYFCMEDTEVWGKVLNRSPRRKGEFGLNLSPRLLASRQSQKNATESATPTFRSSPR